MWRNKIIEIYKEQHATKGITHKIISDRSGVSSDAISRLLNPSFPLKEGPGVETMIAICNAMGVEIWEIFYTGDKSFVSVQAELNAVRSEREALVAENAVLGSENDRLRAKVDTLKDEIIDTHKSYHTIISALTRKE